MNSFSANLFKEWQENCQKDRARPFAQIPTKPKNACNIHNSEFALKKSASYDNPKLSLNTVLIIRRIIRSMARPPLLNAGVLMY